MFPTAPRDSAFHLRWRRYLQATTHATTHATAHPMSHPKAVSPVGCHLIPRSPRVPEGPAACRIPGTSPEPTARQPRTYQKPTKTYHGLVGSECRIWPRQQVRTRFTALPERPEKKQKPTKTYQCAPPGTSISRTPDFGELR